MRPRARQLKHQRGSGSVLSLVVLAASVLLYSALFLVAKVVLMQGQLQSSVDLAAIGASQTLRGLNTGLPCQRARAILTINVAHLETCSIVGDETTVAGTTSVVGIVLNATATASGS